MSRGLFGHAPAPTRFARVVLERSIDDPDGLTYEAPAALGDLAVGERVEAPLGRGDRLVPGYVVEVMTSAGEGIDPDRVKAIRRRTGVRLPSGLIELARWMSRYYVCPPGMVLATMAPAAVKQGVGEVSRLELERAEAGGATETVVEGLSPGARAAWDALIAEPVDAPAATAKELARRLGLPSVAPINRLVKAGLLREIARTRVRAAWDEETTARAGVDKVVSLTAAQTAAVEAIAASLGSFRAHVLRGVTGSGKTEVYLRALDRVIQRGEGAIILVPEISLTPQTSSRFLSRFASAGVAVLHSGLTSAQRHEQWSRLATGRARVVVGARSAVFAPFVGRVGLIVVDEEHDESYKQDQAPRYHARDVAVKRAQIEGCPVVLGSATPSLESWRNGVEGRFGLIELKDRVGGGRLPRVEVVDMVEERRARAADGRVHLLGPRLERALQRTLDDGGQAILLLNRRGFANYICCPDGRCGWVLVCDSCDSTMVLHRDRRLPLGQVVRCHHCLAEQTLPERCPQCDRRVSVFGLGTQRVEEELARLHPSLVEGETMLRVDSDTMRTARDYFRALDRFARGEARLLVGTQMLAKGHDFPNVRLVGVVNADTSINMPDFRASERTFQLVSQVAGRAGRVDEQGIVVVQTMSANAAAIRFAAAHDFAGFAAQESAVRKRSGLPPYARMARVVCRDEDPAAAQDRAAAVVEALRAGLTALGAAERERVRLRGPMPCPLSRIAGFHRVAVELTAESAGTIQSLLTGARNAGALRSDAHTAVDVDPVNML